MKEKNWLILIIIIAAFLRLYNLGSSYLDNDEAKAALGIAFPHSFFLPTLSATSQKIFGANETAAYLPFALLGILGVILGYFLGKEMFSKKAGLIFAFVWTILPNNVWLSRSAYLDIPLVVVWLLILLFWFKCEKDNKLKNQLFLFFSLCLAPWTKIQGIYLLAILFIYLLIIKKGKFWQDNRFWLMGLSFIPFFFYFLSQPQQLYDMKNYVTKEVGGKPITSMLKLIWQAYGSLLLIALGGMIIFLKKIWRGKKLDNFEILISLYSIFILLVLYSTPRRNYYYPMLDLSAVYFCSLGLYYLFTKQKILTQLIMSLALLNILLPVIFTTFSPEDWWICNQSAINSTIAQVDGRKLIYSDDSLGFSGKWYINYEIKKIESLPNGLSNPEVKNLLVITSKTEENPNDLLKNFRVLKDFGQTRILMLQKI
jgi:4-amino-4-deoxy-L-arabinose transferase-like glycosyltransferase